MAGSQANSSWGESELTDLYELADPTGHTVGAISAAALTGMIRQGRLFRTDQISKNGAPLSALGELEEFRLIFDEVMPLSGELSHLGDPLSGQVDAHALVDVFVRLYREGITGRLFVTGGDSGTEKVIVFRQGVPINAMSNIEEEWLGEVLIHKGLIDGSSFQEAADLHRREGARIGDALVNLNKISKRDLQRALSVQAMERLINVFRQRGGSYKFVVDPSAANEEIILLAGPRDIVETGLAAALSPQEVTAVLAGYGDPAFRARIMPPLDRDLSEADRMTIRVFSEGEPLSQVLPRVAALAKLTISEARMKALILMRLGVLVPVDPALAPVPSVAEVPDEAGQALVGRLESLARLDFFRLLDLRRAATDADVQAAYEKKLLEYDAQPKAGEGRALASVREQIRQLLEKARRVLTEPAERDIYQRALAQGLDYTQPEVRQQLEFGYYEAEGRSLMAQKRYEEANRAFAQASAVQPENPKVHVDVGFSQFLASGQDAEAARLAVARVQRALDLSSDLDIAHLAIGKIYRLVGNLQAAEDALRKAIRANPRNNEAQSELRLLFSRELNRKSPIGFKIELGGSGIAGLAQVLGLALLVLFGTYYGANAVSGGLTHWPETGQQKEEAAEEGRGLELSHKMQAAAKKRLLGENLDLVPPEQRVLGNAEYFYSSEDSWWWIRRSVLLVLGLFGMALIVRERPSMLGTKPGWLFAAVPFGVVLGLLSTAPPSLEPLGTLLGMTVFHVFAEQIFFIGFLARGLRKNIDNPMIMIGVMSLIYAAYQATYFATLNQPPEVLIPDVLRVGFFVGGGLSALLWQSGGLLVPLIGHLLINVTMILMS